MRKISDRLYLRIPPALKAALEAKAEREGMTVSTVIRRLIAAYIKHGNTSTHAIDHHSD